jgi:hypothetical protein
VRKAQQYPQRYCCGTDAQAFQSPGSVKIWLQEKAKVPLSLLRQSFD